MTRHRAVGGFVAAILLIGVLGCSADQGATGPGNATSTDPTQGASANPASASPGASDATPGASPSDQPLGAAIGTRSAPFEGGKVELTLHQVIRDGSLSHLDLTLTSADDNIVIAQLLSDGNSSSSAGSPFVADGIRLVDTTNKKLYLVAAASDHSCVCSSLLGVNLDDELPFVVSATFAAIPPATAAVDVQIPRFGTFHNVPVV